MRVKKVSTEEEKEEKRMRLFHGAGFLKWREAIMARCIKDWYGTPNDFMKYISLVTDERYLRLSEAWKQPGVKRSIPGLAKLLDQVGIHWYDFLQEGIDAHRKFTLLEKDQISTVALHDSIRAMPGIVKTHLQEARKSKGNKNPDREIFLQQMGFAPTSKAATINVSAQATAQSAAISDTEKYNLPSFSDSIKNVDAAIREHEKEVQAIEAGDDL